MRVTRSLEPFGTIVQQFLEEEDISLRELVRRGNETADEEDRRNVSNVHDQVTGKIPPSPAVMRLVASAVRVDPETFAEYRMWQTRRALNPRTPEKGGVGFEVAVRNLQLLEQAAGAADQPIPAGLLADRQAGRAPGAEAAESP